MNSCDSEPPDFIFSVDMFCSFVGVEMMNTVINVTGSCVTNSRVGLRNLWFESFSRLQIKLKAMRLSNNHPLLGGLRCWYICYKFYDKGYSFNCHPSTHPFIGAFSVGWRHLIPVSPYRGRRSLGASPHIIACIAVTHGGAAVDAYRAMLTQHASWLAGDIRAAVSVS